METTEINTLCFDLDGTLQSGGKLLPGARKVLEEAVATKLNVVLVSLNYSAMTICDRLGIAEYFDSIISCPYHKAFCLQCANIEKKNAVLFDNDPEMVRLFIEDGGGIGVQVEEKPGGIVKAWKTFLSNEVIRE